MKREVCIRGKLLYSLTVGKPAMIARSGGYTRTTPVVKICEENAEYACFETQNSVYRVTMKPIAGAAHAITQSVLLMCA